MFGFRKTLQNDYGFKFLNISNNIILQANLEGNIFYFIPRYLNCTSWNTDIKTFDEFLQEFNPTNFCIVGDLNARIASEQVLDINLLENLPHIREIRCSRDNVYNTQGKK